MRKASNRGEWIPTPISVYIDEIIEEENKQKSAKERINIMADMFKNIKIRVMHNDTQINLEFDLPDGAGIKEAKNAIIALIENGFVRPMSSNTPKTDNAGKTGVVTSVTKKEGKEQWEVVVKLDEVGAGEQKIISFSAKEYRKGDVVKIVKNAKGYAAGMILEDDERPTRTDDIPF